MHRQLRFAVRAAYPAVPLFLVLASLYALLAYIPYTFRFLIAAPPYAWMPWFAAHDRWLAAFGLLLALAKIASEERAVTKLAATLISIDCLLLTIFHWLARVGNTSSAYREAVVLLIFVAAACALEFLDQVRHSRDDDQPHFSYSRAVAIAMAVTIFAEAGGFLGAMQRDPTVTFRGIAAEVLWVTVSNIWLALLLCSLVNLLLIATRRWDAAQMRPLFGCVLLCAFLAVAATRLLHDRLDFSGAGASLYTACFGIALGTWWTAIHIRGYQWVRSQAGAVGRSVGASLFVLGCGIMLSIARVLGDTDWNGLLSHSAMVIAVLLLILGLRMALRRGTAYSWPALVAVILIAGSAYGVVVRTSFLWGRSLSTDPEEVVAKVERHTSLDAAFDFTYSILERPAMRRCGTLCRTLEAYSNIPHPRTNAVVRLVNPLLPAKGFRPNIFIIVMDSLRPDYLGVYNDKVDFTPNVDAFARDSVVVPHAYSQYAGTSLSEPAIWSGALLLHSHWVQPIQNVNSLARLARTDGYQMVISYDIIVRELFGPEDHIVKLDEDKPWNGYEFSSTAQQFEKWNDSAANDGRPILFYVQPMNVQQLAKNDLPTRTDKNWTQRPGFNNRIAYELNQADGFLGKFFDYLKSRKLYDDSIIILTSDHGEATGELGRIAHSTLIYPEIMRVPLIIHLPKQIRGTVTWDPDKLTALTDVTPSIYYLLGHRPIEVNPIYGQPIFVEHPSELEQYRRDELFLASDSRAAYGLLDRKGSRFYAVYGYPEHSELYDLDTDPLAIKNRTTPEDARQENERILTWLQRISDFYGYRPSGGIQHGD